MTATDSDRRSSVREGRRETRDGLDRVNVGRSVDAEATRSRPAPGEGGEKNGPEEENAAATDAELLAPLILASAYAVVAVAAGPEVFATDAGGASGVVAFGLLGALLLLAGWSTARLYDDTRRIAADETVWQPNPWHYVLGGAAVPTAYRGLELVVGPGVEQPVVYLAGTAIVAGALSSIVAGPVYVLLRRRRRPS